MFGKKGSSGAKSKPKKSVKQGPKVNFFVAHAEKIVLVLVVGLLGFLVYEGFGGKTFDKSKEPKQLADKATSISNNIKNGDPWPAIKELIKDTVPAETNFTPKTEAARLPTDERIYGGFPMGGAGAQPFVKRGDPKLLPPIKVVGQSVIGLIAMEAPDEYVDPFEEFEDAVKLKGKGSGGNSPRARNRAEGGAGGYDTTSGAGLGGAGMDMSGMGGYGGAMGLKRMFPSKYNRGFTLGGAMGAGGYGGMGGMGGGADMGMPGGEMMGAGGVMPGMGGVGGATGTTGGLNGVQRPKQKKYKAEPILFNAVTALVPHEEMLKEFDAKLRDSASFNAMRDKPFYLDMVFERSEVVEGKPDKWEKAGSAGDQLRMMKKWLPRHPSIPEVIDMTSYDRALTMPIPPLLLQDYRKFSKHPDVDWIWDAGMNQMQAQLQVPDQNVPDNADQYLPGEQPMGGVGMGGGGMGMGMGGEMGMAGMAGGGMPGMGAEMGYGGMDGGMAGMAGMAGGGMGMAGMDGGMSGGMAGMEGGGYGMGGMGMGGMGMGMGMASLLPAKYKMIRFFDKLDISKDIGKTFKYRVKIVMEDPNYPSDRFPSPPSNDLEPKVFERVSKRRAEDDPIIEQYRIENRKAIQAAAAQTGPNRTPPRLKVHNRRKLETDFSEPSKGIFVRGFDDVYVHKMGKKQTSPEVEAVIVRLDRQRGAYVPMYFFVEDEDALKKQAEEREKDKDAKAPKFTKVNVPPFRRGSVVALGTTPLTTEFAHPITNVIKRWLNYAGFSEGWNTVVDVRGGEPLAGNKAQEDPLTDNVELMMLMSDGRIEISNEFDDEPQFRGFTLADEREAAEKGTGASGAGAGGMMSGGEDGGGAMGGMGGKRG